MKRGNLLIYYTSYPNKYEVEDCKTDSNKQTSNEAISLQPGRKQKPDMKTPSALSHYCTSNKSSNNS